MRYFIYCRKSSEEEDRQMLSIDAQLRELKEFAIKEKLDIVQVFTESMSAKAPGRPIFNQMLEALRTGEADGVVAWNPDRLARNSRDGGEVIYLIDQGHIKDLRFPTYFYDSSPHGKFNLSLAFGFSKLYVDNLIQNVKRGIREKVKRGEFPGLPPRGYVNNPKTRAIDAHPEYFDLVKMLLERFAIGALSSSEMKQELYQNGITTRKGGLLNHSTIIDMLRNPFYYGVFRLKGELHPGSHPAMISKDTFDRIQSRLDSSGHLVDWSKEARKQKGFLFQQIGTCGEYGLSITREYHKKKTGLEFRYYRCTKKSKTHKCKQKAINENDLADQVESRLNEIAINDNWYQWSMEVITNWRDKEKINLNQEIREFQVVITNNETKLERLLDMYIDGDLTNEEYRSRKNKIINANVEIQDKIKQIESEASYRFEPLALALKTSNEAHHAISQKNYMQMFKILKNIGLNRQLHNKKLNIELIRPFSFFGEVAQRLAKHTSPETTFINKNLKQSELWGFKGNGTVCGEAADRAGSLVESPTLSSAHTASQPRQSHCSDEAVGIATRDSEHTLDQAVLPKAVPPVADSVGELSGVMREWWT